MPHSKTLIAGADKGELVGVAPYEHPDWFKISFLDLQEDVDDAAHAGKRLMLFFSQEACPYCDRYIEHNFAREDLAAKTRKYFDVVNFDLLGDREVTTLTGDLLTEKEFARELDVHFTPTLLVLNEQGNITLRLNGYQPPENFEIALDYVIQRHERQLTYSEYYLQRLEGNNNTELHSQPFFIKPPYDLAKITSDKGKPLAVFFEESNCAICTRLHDDTLSDELTRNLVGEFHPVQLNIRSNTIVFTPEGEQTTAMQWAAKLGISFTPTVVFFDAGGKELMRIDSYLQKYHFQSALDYIASGAYLQQPDFQRYVDARSDALREKGEDVVIWED